jgi:hypothetical protein
MGRGEDDEVLGEEVMDMEIPTIPGDLREALEELDEGMATLGGMPMDVQRRAFLFIERATAHNRGFRIANFVEVVKFFQQDSKE